jgi:hypothetical protein
VRSREVDGGSEGKVGEGGRDCLVDTELIEGALLVLPTIS